MFQNFNICFDISNFFQMFQSLAFYENKQQSP